VLSGFGFPSRMRGKRETVQGVVRRGVKKFQKGEKTRPCLCRNKRDETLKRLSHQKRGKVRSSTDGKGRVREGRFQPLLDFKTEKPAG